eukprot:TRINITY_DN27593_c0_g1_i1.p1 TRINITY_DN27593_c0_g1~~TRINITY_DN27593_c0_g1_i1.p1  ORF type:complete len:311 (+),score=46.53 TRINITY_DN27593_c0_g1_i1:57-935(+)
MGNLVTPAPTGSFAYSRDAALEEGQEIRDVRDVPIATTEITAESCPNALEVPGASGGASAESQTNCSGTSDSARAAHMPPAAGLDDDGAAEKTAAPVRFSCGRCLCLSSVLVTIVAGCLVFFLWPRDPAWTVTHVSFDPDDLSQFIGVAFGNDTNATAKMLLRSVAHLHNPNYVDAIVNEGEAPVTYGKHVIASFSRHSFVVPRRGNVPVYSNVTVSLHPELAMELYGKAMENGGVLTVDAAGPSLLWAWTWFPLRCTATCTVSTNILALFGDISKVIERKSCSYSYSLFGA